MHLVQRFTLLQVKQFVSLQSLQTFPSQRLPSLHLSQAAADLQEIQLFPQEAQDPLSWKYPSMHVLQILPSWEQVKQ